MDYAVICGTGRPGWGVCTRCKGIARYIIEAKGLSGHAGNAPHFKVDAVAEAAHLAFKIHKLGTPLTEDPAIYSKEALSAGQGFSFYSTRCLKFIAVKAVSSKKFLFRRPKTCYLAFFYHRTE